MKYIYILFLLFLFGCSQKEKNIPTKSIFLNSESLSDDMIGMPLQILTYDSILYINDFYGDSLVHCYSLRNKKLLTKIGVKGNGPNELLSPLYLFIQEDSLCLFSRPQQTLYKTSFRTDSVELHKNIRVPQEVSLLFPLTDSMYVCSGMFQDYRFMVLNAKGEIISKFGNYPMFWHKEHDLSIDVKRMFHQIRGYAYSKDQGLAMVDSHTLSIYDHDEKGNFILKKEILLSPYEYEYTDKGTSSRVSLSPSFISGVKDLAILDSCIYILMDVNIKRNKEKKKKEIWKFDWNGNLLCKYIPNIDISHMANVYDKQIILLTNDEKAQIATWKGE